MGKVRYLAAYKKRLERVYSLKNPSKLSTVDKRLKQYGHDPEKLHELYELVCKKYSLVACHKYEGQQGDRPIPSDEKEKDDDKTTTPEQNLSASLTGGFKFAQTASTTDEVSSKSPFSFVAQPSEEK